MGRKGAMLMLMIVALWAATPALGLIAPVPCHSCCKAAMMDCDTATIGAHPCCQMQSSNAAIPAGRAAVMSRQAGTSQVGASSAFAEASTGAVRGPNPSDAPPPRCLSGARSILRI